MSYRNKYSNRKSNRFASFLRTSVVTADATINTDEIALPISPHRDEAIAIYDFFVERSAKLADGKYFDCGLSLNQESTAPNLSDKELVCKIKKIYNGAAAAGATVEDMVHQLHFSPPIGLADPIWVYCIQDSGGAMTFYIRIHYKIVENARPRELSL